MRLTLQSVRFWDPLKMNHITAAVACIAITFGTLFTQSFCWISQKLWSSSLFLNQWTTNLKEYLKKDQTGCLRQASCQEAQVLLLSSSFRRNMVYRDLNYLSVWQQTQSPHLPLQQAGEPSRRASNRMGSGFLAFRMSHLTRLRLHSINTGVFFPSLFNIRFLLFDCHLLGRSSFIKGTFLCILEIWFSVLQRYICVDFFSRTYTVCVSKQTHPVPASNVQGGPQALELDLEHYEVPPPGSGTNHGVQYAADAAETPRGSLQRSASVPVPFYGESRKYQLRQENVARLSRVDSNDNSRDRSVSIKVSYSCSRKEHKAHQLRVSPSSSVLEWSFLPYLNTCSSLIRT